MTAAGGEAQRQRIISELRDLAMALKTRGDDGISCLVYYAAELLERQKALSPEIARLAIQASREPR